MSSHSLIDEEEDYDGEEVKEREEDEDEYSEGKEENEGEFEGEDDEDKVESNRRASVEGSSGSPNDSHTCPFILLAI